LLELSMADRRRDGGILSGPYFI